MAARQQIRETDLYPPVRDALEAMGYTVRAEVNGCDVTATRGEELVVVELKRAFSTTLLVQATDRQRVTDSVYVALPRPPARRRGSDWRGIEHLLRRLELGLILVSFTTRKPRVEIVFHPLPFERRRNHTERRAILREIAGRSADYNVGGSHRRRLLTAYRENALLVACGLDAHGPLSPKQLRALGTGEKTLSILARNVYGWFERVERGIYALKPEGRAALKEYSELVAQLRETLAAAPEEKGSVS